MLIDVHAHLHFPQFESKLGKVMERAKKAGVVSIINSGTDHDGNVKTLELAKKYDMIKASLGIYPRNLEVAEKELHFIEEHKKEIIAIGEVGLDFKEPIDEKEKEKQKKVFLQVIELAGKLKKPMIVHSRQAEKEVINLLEAGKPKKVVMHCFSGNFKLVKKVIDNGWVFSIPATILKSTHFCGLVELAPINQLLTETDAPFLPPPGKELNEPSFVRLTISKIAELKGLTKIEAEKAIFASYQKVFEL